MRGSQLIAIVCCAVAVGCSGAGKKEELSLSQRVASCDIHCAELAMGLVEEQFYDEARAPLERAFEHARDREREDIPWADDLWHAHMLRLATTRAVIAHHHAAIDEEKALREVWSALAELIEVATFESLVDAELTFLRRADRRWMARQLQHADALEDVTREYATMVWQVNSRMSVNRLRLTELSQSAATSRDHLLAAYIHCQIDSCESAAAVDHVGAIVADQMSRPDDAVDVELMQSAFISDFMRNGGEQYAAHMFWIRDWMREADARVHVAIPVQALGRGEACREFRGFLATIVRQREASYGSLIEAARCALSLGSRSRALTLLSRARQIEPQPIDALIAFVEFETMRMHDYHLDEFIDALDDTPEGETARKLRVAMNAVVHGSPEAPALIEALPPDTNSTYLRGMRAFVLGDWAQATAHLDKVYEEWTIIEVARPLSEAKLRLKDLDGAIAVSRRGWGVGGFGWALLHGRVAHATGDETERDQVIEALAARSPSCLTLVEYIPLIALRDGSEAAFASLVAGAELLTERQRRGCRQLLPLLDGLFEGDGRDAALDRWVLSPDLRVRLLLGAKWCTEASVGGLQDRYAAKPGPRTANGLAWCRAQRGEFAEGRRLFSETPKEDPILDTFALLLLRSGEVAQARQHFAELVESRPRSSAYRAHWIAARLVAGEQFSSDALAEELHRVASLSHFVRADPVILTNLARALQDRGFAAEALAMRRLMSRTARDAGTWKRLAQSCPPCVADHVEVWKASPPGLAPPPAP